MRAPQVRRRTLHSISSARIPSDSLVARTLAHGFPLLRFEPALEQEFWQSHHRAAQPRVRFAVLLALCTVIGFALLDHLLLGMRWQLPQDLIRFGVQLPIVLLALTVTSARHYARRYIPAIRIAAPIFGIGSVVMATRALDHDFVTLISARLVLVTFFLYFMLGMSFFAALRSNLLVLAAYVTCATVMGLPAELAIYNVFILGCANLFAGAGSYALEHANRLAFLEHRLLAEVASHDGLTGLLNRAAFESQVRRIWDQALRERQGVAIVMLDIDHFKAFNDRYGHQAGDRCLEQVASAVRRAARRPLDVVARYGGEELIAILPGADRAHGESVACDLVDAIMQLGVSHDASPTSDRVTVSVGVAAVDPQREPSHEAAIRLADRALYMAKEQGRNRAVVLDRSLQVVDFATAWPIGPDSARREAAG
jgi:diguanylate cyclase (GGDEF)-like protein